MIGYRIDLSKPYLVLASDPYNHVLVVGTSKVITTSDGEFGGTEGAWRIPKSRLLRKEQRRVIHWKSRVLGDREADKEYEKICASVIAEHSNALGAQ